MKHTQGEWEIRGNNIISGDRHIADVSIGVANVPYIQVIEEEKANAKIIAAAPELLQALKSLLSVAPILPDEWITPFDKELREAILKSNAAIKKATE